MQKSCRQNCASLEERDYIGLSEASSAAGMKGQTESDRSLLQEPDLQLGLGLGLTLGSSCRQSAERQVVKEGVAVEIAGASASNQKNGAKRGFSEASWHIGQQLASDVSSQDSATDNAPPSKDQVVGWPPVRLYRRQTLSKPAETFVKVNMDGMTVGRKVDLNAYKSYEGLLLALEEMFQPLHGGRESDVKHFLLSSEPDFVLTYEDKDGDWMLVGDVPWSMFTSTVKRLRITRRLEANGTVSTGSLMPKASFRA